METDITPKQRHNEGSVSDQQHKTLQKISSRIRGRYSGLIAATAVERAGPGQREKLTVIVDDLNSVVLNDTLYDVNLTATQQAYDAALNIEVKTMLASKLWQDYQTRDADTLQTLRNALVIHDVGFLAPLQDALVSGRVRPSPESVNMFMVKSEKSLKNADKEVERAIIDIYWAVTDAAHAAAMTAGIAPLSPKDLAAALEQHLVKRNLLHPRCPLIVNKIYAAAKRIMHKEQFTFTGKEYDEHMREADFAVKELREFVERYAKPGA